MLRATFPDGPLTHGHSVREHLCGYDLNLTYPQNGHFPTLQFVNPSDPHRSEFQSLAAKRQFFRKTLSKSVLAASANAKRSEEGAVAKRDLSMRANGTIDPWYGCFIYDEMIDYALNYSEPWSESSVVSLSCSKSTEVVIRRICWQPDYFRWL